MIIGFELFFKRGGRNLLLIGMILLMVTVGQGAILTGQVVDASRSVPLTGAMVTIEQHKNLTAITDSAGMFLFDSLMMGSYSATLSHPLFTSQTFHDIYVTDAQPYRLDVALQPAVEQLETMVVRASSFRRAPDMAASTKIMNFDELLRSPGALNDIQRAVQNLPSVASGGDQTNEIIVRGGVPGENLFLLDNIEIPNPNHFGEQGSGGGVISLVNPLLVKNLTFCAGAPPAQYGGYASSVLDVRLRSGNDAMVIGGVDLGMSGAGAYAEGPLWQGATFMAAANRSFLDFVAQFDPTVAVPHYWGAQLKLSQKINDKQSLTVNGIFGSDDITIGNARKSLGLDDNTIVSGGSLYVSGATWENRWNDMLSTMVTVSGTGNQYDRSAYTDTVSGLLTRRDSSFVSHTGESAQRIDLSGKFLWDGTTLLTGVYGKRSAMDLYQWQKPDTLKAWHYDTAGLTITPVFDSIIMDGSGLPLVNSAALNTSLSIYQYGAYVSLITTIFERLRLVPGARFDASTANSSFSISPRLSAVYALMPSLDITAAAGLQYQNPDIADLCINSRNVDLRPKQAATVIGGIEYLYNPLAIKMVAEAYYKLYNNLAVDSMLTTPSPVDFLSNGRKFSIGAGRSFGLELFAQKNLIKTFSFSVAYALSKSQNADPRPGHSGEWYDADYDFVNSLTLTGGYKTELLQLPWYESLRKNIWFMLLTPIMPLADRLEISLKWRYLGGRPYTPLQYDYLHRRWQNSGYSAALNSERYQDYHKLDVRFERRYSFGFARLIYYIDLQNLYDRDNVWATLYANGTGAQTTLWQLPFFPSGGVILGF